MPRRLFIFDRPDRFVAGAIGQPGSRAFYLQARKGDVVVSVGLEKLQVAALADRMSTLLDAVGAEDGGAGAAAVPLEAPVIEVFRVGAMALAWDGESQTVVVEAQTETDDGEYAEVPDEAAEGPDLLRVRIEPRAARRFIEEAVSVIGAGRPPCPFCGEPLDPGGHFCTRSKAHLN
jgi:uncharacterized repeat protein (TIGR03847 family)